MWEWQYFLERAGFESEPPKKVFAVPTKLNEGQEVALLFNDNFDKYGVIIITKNGVTTFLSIRGNRTEFAAGYRQAENDGLTVKMIVGSSFNYYTTSSRHRKAIVMSEQGEVFCQREVKEITGKVDTNVKLKVITKDDRPRTWWLKGVGVKNPPQPKS